MTNESQKTVWERTVSAVIDGQHTSVQAKVWGATQDKFRPHRWSADAELLPWMRRTEIFGAGADHAVELAIMVVSKLLEAKANNPDSTDFTACAKHGYKLMAGVDELSASTAKHRATKTEKSSVERMNDWVTVWAGELDRESLLAYLHQPGGVVAEHPKSDFGRELGVWYDHDFVWANGTHELQAASALCKAMGVSSEALVQQIARRVGAEQIRSLLLLWDARLGGDAITKTYAGGRLRCLGSWPHKAWEM